MTETIDAPASLKPPLKRRINFDTFVKKYKPTGSPVEGRQGSDNSDCPFFETYGEDLRYVERIAKTDPARVWTVMVNDDMPRDYGWTIASGYHWVNRMFYVVTELPCDRMELDVKY